MYGLSGIYWGGFTNVGFWTKTEFSYTLFYDKRSRNYCEMQVGIWRCFKLCSWFMAEAWWEFRGLMSRKSLVFLQLEGK